MKQHGECKTTGGKLVVVDLTIREGRIQSAQISGDFFVHPESATRSTLDALVAVLIDLPIHIERGALAARLQAVIPLEVELLGTSAEAIAVAVRRALADVEETAPTTSHSVGTLSLVELQTRLTPWKQVAWQLIPEQPQSPAMNVALDEVLTKRVADGKRQPTLRFWRWTSQAVIIGRTQSVSNEVDEQAAKELDVTIVRRMTGGGAMFLQPKGAITYSLYLPPSLLEGMSIRQSYEVCESWVIQGLRELGVDAHHVPINDIACSAGKIGGAAQARLGKVILHHTTIAYDMNPTDMLRVLRIGREKLSDKGVTSAARRVSPLRQQTSLGREEIVQHLFQSFQSRFGGTLDTITPEELQQAEQLVQEKYTDPHWTYDFA